MSQITESLNRINDGVDAMRASHDKETAELKSRIEILEANGDRPLGVAGSGDRTNESHAQKEYRTEFLSWLRKPHDTLYKSRLTQASHDLSKKDVTIGTTTAGGFALPEQISTQIENRVRQLNPFRKLVNVQQCGTNDFKALVGMADGTTGWVGETTSRTATLTPTLRERAPTMGELYAYPQASNWSLEDIFFNVQQWLVDDVSADWSAQEATAIISGNGTNRPTGILNSTPVTTADTASPVRAAGVIQYIQPTTPGSPARINMDSLISLVYTVAERYLQEADACAFVMHRTTAAFIRTLKASTAGSYLWQESAALGQPPTLLGYPVYTCDAMTLHTVADGFPVLFGNWKRGYLLADRIGTTITVDPYTNPGYTRFYLRKRLGGCVLNNDALKALRSAD